MDYYNNIYFGKSRELKKRDILLKYYIDKFKNWKKSFLTNITEILRVF